MTRLIRWSSDLILSTLPHVIFLFSAFLPFSFFFNVNQVRASFLGYSAPQQNESPQHNLSLNLILDLCFGLPRAAVPRDGGNRRPGGLTILPHEIPPQSHV